MAIKLARNHGYESHNMKWTAVSLWSNTKLLVFELVKVDFR